MSIKRWLLYKTLISELERDGRKATPWIVNEIEKNFTEYEIEDIEKAIRIAKEAYVNCEIE